MLISVFTPSHAVKFLPAAYASLRAQTFEQWEWIVLLNGTASLADLTIAAPDLVADPRVRIRTQFSGCELRNVGFLKRAACEEAEGDFLLELDHDDLLTPHALASVAECVERVPDLTFAYSNCASVNADWSSRHWNLNYGWEYRQRDAFGHVVDECLSPAPVPQNFSRIWYAPDHVRVWSRKAYWQAGGHDRSMKVGDDHDLICRTALLPGQIVHIDDLLYIQMVHGQNTWLEQNADIQTQQWANYEKYKEALAARWASDHKLRILDLSDPSIQGPNLAEERWPFEDGSVGVIRAEGALQSLPDPIHTMNEIHRVLAHGGFLFSSTPSTDGRGAFQDPTHYSYWNQNSFWYYTKASHGRYIAARSTARFQALKIETLFPTDFCKQNDISYVQADLIALKTGLRFHGLQEI